MFVIIKKITTKKQIRYLKIFSYSFLAAGGLIAVFSIIAGAGTNRLYYWELSLAVLLFAVGLYAYMTQKRISLLLTLRNNWGKGNRKTRDYQQIATLYNYSDKTINTIDQQTWNDFGMDEVYAKIDATMTTPGEEVLYALLREPFLGRDELTERSRIISLFQENAILREKVQVLFHDLGRQKANGLTHLLWGELPPKH
ncbi:MAG TPA: hypothetical protein GX697_04740, partial [Firmicutes bacterium]|nr:hypothetical protein [Bacillota bacterium]